MEEQTINETITSEKAEQPVENNKKTIFKRTKNVIVTFFIIFSIYFVFSIFFFNILLTPLSVQDYSMYPTLNAKATGLKGEYNTDIVYLKKTQNVSKRDIIVFDASDLGFEKQYFIKRVIATAGDKLQFVTDQEATDSNRFLLYKVFINGKEINEKEYASEIIMEVGYPDRDNIRTSDFYKKIITESMITIPEGHVFVMGDNRAHSTDSRDFGLIKQSQIFGKVKIHLKNGSNMIFAIFHSMKESYLFN